MSSLSTRSAGVSLRDLLAGDAQVVGSDDVHVTSCTNDFRRVRPGDAFVALTEASEDGHDLAVKAAERGASAVICERLVPVFGVPQLVVRDSHAAYGRLCQALMGNPSRELKVIGVTGTSGKSTVVRLLRSIFQQADALSGAIDSWGYCDGSGQLRAADSNLSAPALARSLARMVADGASHAVVEISSRELSRSVLSGVELDAACLTHVGRDHLDWHGSLTNYRQAKRRIFDHLHAAGIAVLNADDSTSMEMLSRLDCPALTVGMRQPAEITAEIVEQHINEQTFVLTAGDESVGVRTTIVGDHHVYNCLTAAALCLAYRIDLTTVARGLEAVDGLPGRMERVACGQEFAVIVDAAHTPDQMRACLRTARRVTSGRLICVFGAFADRERSERTALGRVVGSMADLGVVTSNHFDDGDADGTCAQVLAGLADVGKGRQITDRVEAIAWALDAAREGDTVVVAGRGDRPYGEPGDDGIALDDREVVRQMLYGIFPNTAPKGIAA